MEENENGHFRGLHIVIFDPFCSKIIKAQVFDTYLNSSRFNEFIKTPVPKGLIVIAACMDDCSMKLSPNAKKWFVNLGSK